jgi:hypothetical protein
MFINVIWLLSVALVHHSIVWRHGICILHAAVVVADRAVSSGLCAGLDLECLGAGQQLSASGVWMDRCHHCIAGQLGL